MPRRTIMFVAARAAGVAPRFAAVAAKLAAVAALAAGCYSPSPATGSYLCGADHACPSSQHCACGLCVNQDSEAACRFTLNFPGAGAGSDGGAPTVDEHQPFSVAIQALAADGTPASGFNGAVALSSSWGDVSPTSVALKGGAATAMVSLNRETLPPAVAKLTARFAGNGGTSSGINVNAPKLAVQAELSPPFGWAIHVVADANVIKAGGELRMYFVGAGPMLHGFGVATSPDGINWTPTSAPILEGADLFSPSVYGDGSGTQMAYASPTVSILRATSTDGLTPFQSRPAPLLQPSSCSYCTGGVTFPQVLPDLAAGPPDGGAAPWLMFFSAASATTGSVGIGRASSPDGVTWTPEPAAVLQGDLAGEAILLSPRVVLDGSVYKMWYSFAALSKISLRTCATNLDCPVTLVCGPNHVCSSPATDPFSSFCEIGTTISIGYAHSSDGFFWTRSEKNPVLDVEQVEPGAHALLVSSVIASDGANPSAGLTLYYSTFRRVALAGGRCIPNGIGRATRP